MKMYSVPVIPADLRHEETIIQSANALDYLDNTINDLFDKIDNRIERNNKKINELKSRINLANKKINSLIGINKAIKIFSPSKFPAAHIFCDIPQTFNEFDNIAKLNKNHKKIQLNDDYEIKSNQEPVTQKLIQEKLQFYHVRSKNKSKLLNILEQKQGLGPIPRHLSSINSLLLYNTSENVYENYKNMDALMNRTKSEIMNGIKGNELSKLTDRLEAAPISITNRLYNDKKINQGLFYTPKLNDAPEIDVPLDLPDLPGIADDIIFDVSENDKIAPSMFIDNLPDLPEPIILESSKLEEQPSVDSVTNEDKISKSNTVTVALVPPPPPPPPLPPNDFAIVPSPPPVPSSLLIPPPPPISPSLSTERPIDSPTVKSNSTSNINDARMNLMEAIRQAGGAKGGKLRAAADVIKTKEENSKSSAGGNLMADLHNRLSMRRKGISGAKEQENSNIGSGSNSAVVTSTSDLMKKVLVSIPPPELNSNSSTDGSDSDADWAG